MAFRFKQFAVEDSACAMKVGTDGVLLGVWAKSDRKDKIHILDAGSGSGLIALMLAQRFPDAEITGIDIDKDAVQQSQDNFLNSPWSSRLKAYCVSFQQYSTTTHARYDLIASNPPFFQHSLHCPDPQRTQARHTCTLPYEELLQCSLRLLKPTGSLQLILPAQEEKNILATAQQSGFFLQRICRICGRVNKPHKRILLHLGLTSTGIPEETELILETEEGRRTQAYQELCKEFYL